MLTVHILFQYLNLLYCLLVWQCHVQPDKHAEKDYHHSEHGKCDSGCVLLFRSDFFSELIHLIGQNTNLVKNISELGFLSKCSISIPGGLLL
jgi:hypothetical protein